MTNTSEKETSIGKRSFILRLQLFVLFDSFFCETLLLLASLKVTVAVVAVH